MDDRFEGLNSGSEAADPKDMVVRAFSRCSNYPKEMAGVQGLAQGLVAASGRYGVRMEAIISACAEASTYCPTDSDLMSVARALKPAEKVGPRTCPLGECDGSGWVERYTLHTHHSTPGSVWVEKKNITREQYDDLSRKIDWKTQKAYSGRKRCQCHPARAEDSEKRGKYA